jgi:hypothetical protein
MGAVGWVQDADSGRRFAASLAIDRRAPLRSQLQLRNSALGQASSINIILLNQNITQTRSVIVSLAP